MEPAPTPTRGGRLSQAVYGSDLIVELLASLGYEYIAINPGASFRGLHDSLVNFRIPGAPKIITCTHEEIAVAMGHGYWKTAGKPMAAALHNIVGLQHGAMAIFNAWCDRAPVMVLGGTGPMDASMRRPHIDWVHTALVQGNQVRDYVKLDDQPASIASFPESMLRTHKVMMTEPHGPVYVCFDVDLQEDRLAAPITVPDPRRYLPAASPAPNRTALAEAVDLLVAADWPVILVEDVGREAGAFGHLRDLAEALGCGVIDRGGRISFASNHPLDLSLSSEAALKRADVVLALNVLGLGNVAPVPHQRGLEPTHIQDAAKVIHITMTEYLVHSWATDYERLPAVDVLIGADPVVALPELLELVRSEQGRYPAARDKAAQRRASVEVMHNEALTRVQERSQRDWGLAPISAARLYGEIWAQVQNTPWAMNRQPRGMMDFSDPAQSFTGGGGGGGLGYSYPAALGGRLGMTDRDRVCINISGDGDFLMTSNAMWTASHYNIPVLQIIFNNRAYYQDEGHQSFMARDRERPTDDLGNGIMIDNPNVDHAGLAKSFGIEGFGPVGDPDKLGAVLRQAIHAVRDEQRPVLVDVLTQKR